MQAVGVDVRDQESDIRLVELGEAIKYLIDQIPLTQAEFAKQLGVDAATVSRIINGKAAGITLQQIRDMEVILNLSRGSLFVAAGMIEPPIKMVELIESDSHLTPTYREIVSDFYRSCVDRSERERSARRSNKPPAADKAVKSRSK